MEALSTSMGVCGSVGAGLGASANVPSINFCSESLSTVATPCICRKKRGKQRCEEKKERQKLTEEVRRKAENERHKDIMWRARVAGGQSFTQSFTSIWRVMRERSDKHFQKLYVLIQDWDQSNLKWFWGFDYEGERLLMGFSVLYQLITALLNKHFTQKFHSVIISPVPMVHTW